MRRGRAGGTNSVLAVRAVAVVPLGEHDGLSDGVALLGRDETKDGAETRVSLGVRVGDTHASSGGDVEAEQLLRLLVHDRDEADVVGEDVDVVVRRDGYGNLELETASVKETGSQRPPRVEDEERGKGRRTFRGR